MTVLFVGSSASDIGGSTLPYTGTAQAVRDPDYTPEACYISTVALGINKTVPFSIFFENTTDMWMHFRIQATGTLNTNSDGYYAIFYSGSTTILTIDMLNAEFSILDSAGGTNVYPSPFTGSFQTIDYNLIDNGATYTFSVYVNSVLYVSHTWTNGSTGVTTVEFSHNDFEYSGTVNIYYSEFIVTDGVPTIGWRLASLKPDVQGTYDAWEGVPSNLAEFGDGQSISTGSPNVKESWLMSPYLGPITSSGVYALINKSIGSIGDFGPTQITPFIRHAGVDVEAAPYAPTPGGDLQILYSNPQTGLPWDTADFAALEIGVKSTA